MKVPSVVMGGVMLVMFVAMVAIAWSYPAGARFQPFVIGLPAIALCILQIVLDLTQSRGKAVGTSAGGNEFARAEAEISKATGRKVEFEVAHAQLPQEEKLSAEGELGREIAVWLFFLGFIGGVMAFGFWIAIPVFLFTFLTVRGGVRIPKALLMTIIGTMVFYVMFEMVLRVKVHEGFYGPWLWEQIGALPATTGVRIGL